MKPQHKDQTMESQAIHLYNKLASNYKEEFDIPHRHLYDEIAWEIVSEYLTSTNDLGNILDAGGGVGRWSIRIAKLGFSVTMVDISPEMCKIARKMVKNANLEGQINVIEGDHSNLQVDDNQFDFVIAIGSLQYSSDPLAVVKEWYRVLRAGGGMAILVDGKYARVSWLLSHFGPRVALQALKSDKSKYKVGKIEATHYIFTPSELHNILKNIGLKMELTAGLLSSVHALENDEVNSYLKNDFNSIKLLEQQFSRDPSVAGYGRHILVVAKKKGN